MSEPLVHIIFTETQMLLSKAPWTSWREIQDAYPDYKTSLGPWTAEEAAEWLADEYARLSPPAGEQMAAFLAGDDVECEIEFTPA